jgi:hypothetical protein
MMPVKSLATSGLLFIIPPKSHYSDRKTEPHPKSLANLAPGQERREGWKETRLRLSERAHGWLRERRQGKGGMSGVVEGLIMREIEKEES